MFKAESGSLRFSSATATDAASGRQSADRSNGRGTALGDIGFVGLGRMGTAMVLAFKDQPKQSNEEFIALLGKEKKEKQVIAGFWYGNPPLREMMAKALNHNYANAPEEFPDKLKAYRDPPRPTLKAP